MNTYERDVRMGFPQHVADEVLVKCRRHCCVCGKHAGSKIELHHIIQVADGGDDSADNCLPVCFDCHADIKAFNPHHPKGRKFTEKELKSLREQMYERFMGRSEETPNSKERLFSSKNNSAKPIWGIQTLDRFSPVIPGSMILIAGYTGSRKSAYIQHICNINIQREQKVAYCCLKESPSQIGLELIAEDANISLSRFKQGRLTENEWDKIAASFNVEKSSNLALLPYEKVSQVDQLIKLIRFSQADIVVVDDINGLCLAKEDAEHAWYNIRNAASQSGAVVFALQNMDLPVKRSDMRPCLADFRSSVYRLFDIVQFTYIPQKDDRFEPTNKNVLEVITVKGSLHNEFICCIHASDETYGIATQAVDDPYNN